jgi:hypothetical protein
MATLDEKELTLLAAMAYGESYYKNDVFEEMAGISSVLIRQRDARGYSSMQEFVKAEPTYSYVVKDGNPRYAQLINTTEAEIKRAEEEISTQQLSTEKEIQELKEHVAHERDKKKIAALGRQLNNKEKALKRLGLRKTANAGHLMAYRAARNAIEGGTDYSNGAYFWDGWDVKTNYDNHPKVRRGIKIIDSSHDVFGIEDNEVTVIKYKVVVVTKNGKKTKTTEEVGRYDHLYESTAGHGGTIFWKFSPTYLELERAKVYK